MCGGGDWAQWPRKRAFEQPLPVQVDVIKKAYVQEEERENSEVSPREVGHNIYILALQVPPPPPTRLAVIFPPRRALPRDFAALSLSSPGTTSSCSTC